MTTPLCENVACPTRRFGAHFHTAGSTKLWDGPASPVPGSQPTPTEAERKLANRLVIESYEENLEPAQEKALIAQALADQRAELVARYVGLGKLMAADELVAMADGVRTTEVLFRRADGSGVKYGDLLRGRAAELRAEVGQ